MARRFDRKGYQRDMGRCTGTRKYRNGSVGKCNHPSHGCFASETLIRTPSGEKKIADIVAGDTVLGFDAASGKANPRRVIKKITRPPMPLLLLSFRGNLDPIRVTASHSLLTRTGGWRRAGALQSGDLLIVPGENDAEVTDVADAGIHAVFNLIVENDCTFLAGPGVAAHSYTVLRTWRTRLEKMKSYFRVPDGREGEVRTKGIPA